VSATFTPGPWAWFGNRSGGVYLATPDRGRRYVMGFQRYGMNGAQPSFSVGSIMRPAAELVAFAVGDGTARGFKQADKDTSVYRYDVSEIDHPDARLIAAAPDLYDAALAAMEWIEGGRIYDQQCCGGGSDCGCRGSTYADEAVHYLRAALAKATGA
jgi:hypothetical protein